MVLTFFSDISGSSKKNFLISILISCRPCPNWTNLVSIVTESPKTDTLYMCTGRTEADAFLLHDCFRPFGVTNIDKKSSYLNTFLSEKNHWFSRKFIDFRRLHLFWHTFVFCSPATNCEWNFQDTKSQFCLLYRNRHDTRDTKRASFQIT